MKEYKGFDHNFSLQGKTALITGGAQGIGKAFASLFAEKGARIALFDQNERVLSVARELNEKALTQHGGEDHTCPRVAGYVVDITDEAATDEAFDSMISDFGRVDILCNVAGVGGMTPATEITRAEWDKILSVNLTALFFLTQRVGRFMIDHDIRGKVVSMASDASLIGLEGHGHYGPTKAGVDNLTKVLANEWGPHGINVNCISPTVVMTEMGREFWVGEVAEEMLSKIPVGRFVEPEEVAAAALFLASDASDMISGHNLVIDGAFTVC